MIITIVAKYRLDSLAELARQMAFTPAETRAAQVASAEGLLHLVDPAKAYPLDFVVFRITGYHPKHTVAEDLLTGLAIQHDLGLLIEQVSESLDLHTTSLAEPVLTIDDVCERFNVTSKTIQRWRRRGLPARRFTFSDGKRRVGFLLGSVERFVGAHHDQVATAGNFSQVDDAERDLILRRARRLATQCHCCVGEITRRIARRMNRSPLTVLHVVKKFDQEHPEAAIFPQAGEPVSDADRAMILKAFRRGVSMKRLARRTCRPRSAVYRVIVDERIARVKARKVRFIDDPLYHQDDARATIDAIVAQQAELAAPAKREDSRVPRDLPPYLQELYRIPLLTPARERALFLKFNFHKYLFVAARRRLDPDLARARDLNQLEGHLRRATDVKNAIVAANLRLVVSVARKHLRTGLSLAELISDGNITLMRAVEGFDLHKGHRFSTYATLALMKGFARSVPQMLAGLHRAGDELALASVADPRLGSAVTRVAERDEVHQLLARLTDRERRILCAHFGLETGEGAETCEQVGERLGLSRERIRQIEQAALAKLRDAVGTP